MMMGLFNRLLECFRYPDSARTLLRNHAIVAVHFPASTKYCTNRATLDELSRILSGTYPDNYWSPWHHLRLSLPALLPDPDEVWTLEFEGGERRDILVGERGKLTAARAVKIDGETYIVKSPGLSDLPLDGDPPVSGNAPSES